MFTKKYPYKNKAVWIFFCLFLTITSFQTACQEPATPSIDHTPYPLVLPIGFPHPIIPDDNPLTIASVELGKKLFFDPILSRDSSISCGSCHFRRVAFTDERTIALGIDDRLGFRNTATLANVAYEQLFFKDGGVRTLELQVVAPIEDENEMDFNILSAVDRLNENPEYVLLSQKAYGREPDAFVLTRAIATFERTLISGNSPFDQYFYQNDLHALNEQEIRGMNLFFSTKTNCSSCHSGFNFTNQEFVNTGLYEQYVDTGRKRVTLEEADNGKFKVPTLRNIAVTAPYMHDGSLATLTDVLNHYENGGKAHPNKSPLIQPIVLSDSEKQDLMAFLESLTDSVFIEGSE